MSDLHLETHPTYDYDFPKTAPHLALLGDIGHVASEHLTQFIVRQLLRYRTVFFLLGNHEPFHTSWDFAKERMHKFSRTAARLKENDASIGKFVFLEKTRYDLDDEFTVLGCTLFSKVSTEQAAAVQARMVDFRDILHWDVGDHVDAHLEDLQWLNSQVAELAASGKKVIILTHHSPSTDRRARDPRYPQKNEVETGFATDLSREDCWTSPAVVLWAFGHTHYSCDFIEGGKRVVANQKGYHLKPQKAFCSTKVVRVGEILSSPAEAGLPA